MPAPESKQPIPDPAPGSPSKLSIHRLEATGIVVIAILLLILTLIRYWRHIPWAAH